MIDQKSDIALLVFGLTAQEEVKRKSFVKNSPSKNLLIAKSLFHQTSFLTKELPIDIVYSTEKIQKGRSFGERLVNDIERIFQIGYKKLIIIGTDCPSLSVHHLQLAISSLRRNKAIIGPSNDGGIYLLGMSAAQFNKQQFLKLPWQSRFLKDELSSKIGIYENLEPLSDIDHAQDFIDYVAITASNPLKKLFIRILKDGCIILSSIDISKRAVNKVVAIFFRGPPSSYPLHKAFLSLAIA